MPATSGWAIRWSTIALPPSTTFRTPRGRPAPENISARRKVAEGSRSLGLRTTVLPQAIAIALWTAGISTGKLNGLIATTTPMGKRTSIASTPRDTPGLNAPPYQLPTEATWPSTSIARSTSAPASATVFPDSLTTMLMSSSRASCRARRRSSITDPRCCNPSDDQTGNAARAAATALSTSADVPIAATAVSCPLVGLRICEPPSAENSSPAMKWPTCFIVFPPAARPLCDHICPSA